MCVVIVLAYVGFAGVVAVVVAASAAVVAASAAVVAAAAAAVAAVVAAVTVVAAAVAAKAVTADTVAAAASAVSALETGDGQEGTRHRRRRVDSRRSGKDRGARGADGRSLEKGDGVSFLISLWGSPTQLCNFGMNP